MRVPTVNVLIGPPGSGKSTVAKEWLSKNPNLVRMNRDDFRMSFFGKTILDKTEEKRLTKIIKTLTIEYLKAGKDVILDNKHCNLATLQGVADDYNHLANINYLPMYVEYDILIERNSKRENPVPEDVIKRMYKAFTHIFGSFPFQFKPKKETLKHEHESKYSSSHQSFYIFDIDRTLSLPTNRYVYDFQRAGSDAIIEPVFILLKLLYTIKYPVMYITGRPDSCRDVTLTWLKEKTGIDIPSENLLMRKEGDGRSSRIVKEEIYLNELHGKINIVAWFDDDAEVVEMLKQYNIFVLNTTQE